MQRAVGDRASGARSPVKSPVTPSDRDCVPFSVFPSRLIFQVTGIDRPNHSELAKVSREPCRRTSCAACTLETRPTIRTSIAPLLSEISSHEGYVPLEETMVRSHRPSSGDGFRFENAGVRTTNARVRTKQSCLITTQSSELLIAQRSHRIHAHGPPRRNITRHERYQRHQRRNEHQDRLGVHRQALEHASQKIRERECA